MSGPTPSPVVSPAAPPLPTIVGPADETYIAGVFTLPVIEWGRGVFWVLNLTSSPERLRVLFAARNHLVP